MSPVPPKQSHRVTSYGRLALSEGRVTFLAAVVLLNVVIALFGDVLSGAGDRVISSADGAIAERHALLRGVSFESLRNDEMPLWNPYLFAGTPGLGGFESGVYYPLNLMYVALPLAAALNIDLALHLFLFGFFTYVWLRRMEFHAFACVYGGAVAMLSGAYFLHAANGQVSLLAGFTWLPVILIAVHDLARGRAAIGTLTGVVGVTMQLLSGYPMSVVYSGVAALFYGFAWLGQTPHIRTVVRGIAVMATAPLLVAAAQLWIGLDTLQQSVRAVGVSRDMASFGALPLENLFTVAAPSVFGNGFRDGYSGRGAYSETNLFAGIVTLTLAMYGLLYVRRRMTYIAAALGVALLGCALSGRFILFQVAADSFTPFAYLAHSTRFAIPATLFGCLVAVTGLNRFLRRPEDAKRIAAIAMVFAVVMGIGAVVAGATPDRATAEVVEANAGMIPADGEVPSFGGDDAVRGWLVASGMALLLSALVGLVPLRPTLRYGVVGLGVVELFVFAAFNRPAIPADSIRPAAELTAFADDQRVFDMNWRNRADAAPALSTGGSGGLPLRRYMELLAHTQWTALERRWNGGFGYVGYHPLLRMLRVGTVSTPEGEPNAGVAIDDRLPRFLIMHDYVVLDDKDAIFSWLESPTFDPWKTVILESEPLPAPGKRAASGTVSIIQESNNAMTITADVDAPALLLMTDAYARGWTAKALRGSAQWGYDVLPANYALRAIPLGEGKHLIRIAYKPWTHRVGAWVSVFSAMVLLAATVRMYRQRYGRPKRLSVGLD